MSEQDPKTVVRAPPGQAGPSSGFASDPFAGLAGPAIGFANALARARKPDPAETATELRRLIGQFEQAARRAGIAPDAILDARDALITLTDARARSNPALRSRAWGRALAAALPLGAGIGLEPLRRRAEAASRAGPAQRDRARLLRHCLEASEASRPADSAHGGAAIWVLLLVAAGLAAWVGWAEWRYRDALLAGMPDPAAAIAAASSAPPEQRAAALDRMAAAVASVEAAAPGSPVGLVHRIAAFDPAVAAGRRYGQVADALLPAPLWAAIDAAVATDGDPTALYDTLRARAILAGESDWQPVYLAGWLADRAGAQPELAGLARHVTALSGPARDPGSEDAESLGQARAIAADGGAAERAFLELRRADTTAALPDWRIAAAVPGLVPVLVRRSGRPLAEGIAGLYTAAGWAATRDGGAAAAIARAQAETDRLIGARAMPAQPEQVLDLLQIRTLATWKDYLADLRVRPFTDQPGALAISGALGAARSPLSALIREVWRQSGGEDRTRPHPDQTRVATAFGPAIQFVEQGRMDAVSRLFLGLNVALASVEANADLGEQRLMSVQAQASSIATLQQAPALVVEIIEDVLAQTAAENPALGRRPELQAWQSRIASACTAAIAGRYPFADGPDADPLQLAGLFAQDGLVARFFQERLAPLIDSSETPWRWKPEARLSGFSADSAAFFERAAALGAVYFVPGGLASVPLTVEVYGQHGSARIALGGSEASIDKAAPPATLRWPGPDPARGASIAFAGGAHAGFAGPWGLLHLLDGRPLRMRDSGRHYMVDLKLADARLYFRLSFDEASNPVSARALLNGLTCPATL